MKIRLWITTLMLGITQLGYGQNLNMVIEVNERLVTSELGSLYLNFENDDGTKSRKAVGYHPGELILKPTIWEKINSESTKKIFLTFDYYVLKGKWHNSVNFEIEMKKHHFDKRYLVLNVYDFRERKYRRKYGCLTDKNYIFDFNYPQGGILIRCG